MLKRLLVHASNYSIANVAVALAGLISFPIFTRIFSVSEYGLLNLVSATLGLMVGLGKLGLQTSVLRFYAEATNGKSAISEGTYFSTALLGMLVTGTCATLLFLLFVDLVPASFWGDPRMRGLLMLTAVLIVIRVVDSGLVNILRAQQRSGTLSLYSVCRRYGALAITLFVVFHVLPGLTGFYLATVAAELCATAVLAFIVLRRQPIRLSSYSAALMGSMLAFGLPMVANEIGGQLLWYGNRYVIQAQLGGEQLGIYAAAHNLSEYVQTALLAPFGMAVTPMFTRIWEKDGKVATQRFIETALHFYVLAAVAVACGMAAVGGDLLALLASAKYLPGATVIPWVMTGMVIDGFTLLLGAGLYLQKRSKVVMVIVACSAAANLGLNFILVPPMGIKGAAVATLVTCCGMSAAFMLCGRRHLPIQLPWVHALKTIGCGMLAYLVAVTVEHDHLLASILLKLGAGIVAYMLLVGVVDRQTREATRSALARIWPARQSGDPQ